MTKERDNSEALVGRAINFLFRQSESEQKALWLGRFRDYDSLPKNTSSERKKAKHFVGNVAVELLQNPQDIDFMKEALADRKNNANTQNPKQQFVQLVRNECLGLIKEDWQDVKPEQLAKLVNVYANSNAPSQDFAKDLLTNYFKGPRSRNQRIGAYYNFVSGVLDLAGDKEAFIEGMKIALHATEDVLPRVPSLAEQTGVLSLPFDITKEDFQKLLIARRIVYRVSFMDPKNLGRFFQDRTDFLNSDSTLIDEGDKRKNSAIRYIGADKTKEMYFLMKGAIKIIVTSSREPSQDVKNYYTIKSKKETLKPVELAFDPTDPLNQKFKRVFRQMDASITGLL